jgi:hypothetical protein
MRVAATAEMVEGAVHLKAMRFAVAHHAGRHKTHARMHFSARAST